MPEPVRSSPCESMPSRSGAMPQPFNALASILPCRRPACPFDAMPWSCYAPAPPRRTVVRSSAAKQIGAVPLHVIALPPRNLTMPARIASPPCPCIACPHCATLCPRSAQPYPCITTAAHINAFASPRLSTPELYDSKPLHCHFLAMQCYAMPKHFLSMPVPVHALPSHIISRLYHAGAALCLAMPSPRPASLFMASPPRLFPALYCAAA